ncbi:MAG: 4Fe-4S binding protein [Candidatus Heimdallarchaeota archaeon]
MNSKQKLGRFIAPSILLFPFLQSLYLCPFPLPWIVCGECPIFSCLMNPKTTPIRRILLVNFLVSGLLVGKAFCSWTCPYGALQEIGSTCARKLEGINPLRKDLRIIKVFFGFFAFLIAYGLAYPILLGFFSPLFDLSFILDPIYIVGVTLTSTILTVPWIFWVLRVFTFTFFLGLSIFMRRSWCKICPLGTILGPFNKVSLIGLRVNRDKCEGHKRCSLVCQMDLEPLRNGLKSVDCIRCLDCAHACGPSAIEVKSHFFNWRKAR